jgi:heptosyltransferase III
MKILVIKRDKLGDLLLTTPLLAHLRASLPEAEIHLLANDYNAWVASGHPALDRTWIYPRTRIGRSVRVGAVLRQAGLTWQLRRARFDVAVVAQGEFSPRAVQRALWVRARRTIAYVPSGEPLRRAVDHPLDPPTSGHETSRILALGAPLGIAPPDRLLYPTFALPAASAAFARDWLADFGLSPQRYIVFGLGARRSRKQPSADQIARWTTEFKRTHGLDTVFMWTPGGSKNPLYPGDDDAAQAVLARKLPHLHPFRGPIQEALGLVWAARTSIFPDSGLMHFAAASPGGVLGLFAEPAVHVEEWAPLGPRAYYLAARETVAEFSDEQVYAALAPLLLPDSGAPPPAHGT